MKDDVSDTEKVDAPCCQALLFWVMTLFIFFVVGFAITNTIVFLHVFSGVRRFFSGVQDYKFHIMARTNTLKGFRLGVLGRFVHCHTCMGAWVGAFLSIVHGGFISEYMCFGVPWVVHIFDGFFLSGANFFAWLILRKLGAEEL